MQSIKSYTDIEQSKKLTEMLPLESADMNYWCGTQIRIGGHRTMDKDLDVPCWSLASLLSVLPILDNRSPVISKTFDRKYRVVYHSTAYEKAILTSDYDNPVDACVAMVIRLHESNLL